ncbi:MAG TPA: ribonuclease R [Cytophagales bacterium]|nr:ribonuclease R [Cytophagales bacterium]
MSRKNKAKQNHASKKRSERAKSEPKFSLKVEVLRLFRENPNEIYPLRQLYNLFSIQGENDKLRFKELMSRLAHTGKVKLIGERAYMAGEEQAHIIEGWVDYVNFRFAFILNDTLEVDIKIKTENMMGAFDGDLVKVIVWPSSSEKDEHPEGEVIEIIKRKRETFVGRLEISDRFAFLVPDGRKIHKDIFVAKDKLNGAKKDEKVIVKVHYWPNRSDKNPEGAVVSILGKAGNNNTEMHAIMAEFGLPTEFEKDVLEDAEKISEVITPEEIKKRRDFRDITTFTIDPEDAKDFDDALSIQKLENGNWEIGIHIADVTHYVKPGTTLEREAEHRATSVYLVDRTVPMLPERLSNFLCSLRPNEDKLTFSAVFELDEKANVIHEWFGRTIIHSNKRFSYEKAQECLESGEGDFAEEVMVLNTLAKKLQAKRFKNGAISFETVEVKFKLDEAGRPLGLFPKIRKDAHKLIEEFMLLANKRVAEFCYRHKEGKEHNTMVYRVHDEPDIEKIRSFSLFASKFGYKLMVDESKISEKLNDFIEKIEGSPEQYLLQNLAIRTMAKARYTTAAAGHFGLAFSHYSHFTSPIRRFPDMMTHLLLQNYLDNKPSPDRVAFELRCKHSSEMEKLAADAERASIKYKQVEYMQMAGKKVFEGIVSGVTGWGMYVDMNETRCEGMVRMSDMNSDFFELDEKNYRLVGKKTGKTFTLGDTVHVKVKNTSLEKRTIDLSLVDKNDF